MKLGLINESEVKLVGRKGAIGLAVLKLSALGYAIGLAVGANPDTALAAYLQSLFVLAGLFFAGNATEHIAKRGQKADAPTEETSK